MKQTIMSSDRINSGIRYSALMLSAALVFFLSSCGGDKKNETAQLLDSLETQDTFDVAISDQVLEDIIRSIPSPLEISFLIKESGYEYNSNLINSPDNSSSYNTNYEKALNLGIYSTDLGFANIYNQYQDAISILTSVRNLSSDLNIGDFLDFNTLRKLVKEKENLDSLLYITTQNFEKINMHLHEQNRSNLSVLILTGGWLEAVHLTCRVAEKGKNDALYERIGEQKIILDKLLQLITYYENKEKRIKELKTDFSKLADIYKKVEISYEYAEPTVEEVDGVLMVKNNTKSVVKIDKPLVEEISKTVELIRNKAIK